MGFCSYLKIFLPVAFAFLWSPVPRRLGVYEYLHNLDDPTVGIWPSSFSSVDKWGFTFDDLYGDGGFEDEASIQKYRKRLWGQTALVTGANVGIGYEIALAVHRLGASVTLACRTPAKCEAAAQKIREDSIVKERGNPDAKVRTWTVDLSSLESVATACEQYLKLNDDTPLDMFFQNAGILFQGGEKNEYSVDGIEKVFHTNVVGHHLMYRLLEPVIYHPKRTTPARIALTSSASSYDTMYPYKVATDLETLNNDPPLNFWSPYPQSKLAQILWIKELTDQLDQSNNNNHKGIPVYVNAAHPGWVVTNILNNGMFDSMPFPEVLRVFMYYLGKLAWTAEEGALTLIYLGTALEDLASKGYRGQYFHPQSIHVPEHRDIPSDDPETKKLQVRLWNFLDELVADYAPKTSI